MIYIVDTHTHTQCTSSDKLIRPADFNAGHLSLLLYAVTTTKKCVPLWEIIAIIVKKEESPNQIFIISFFLFREEKSEL